MNLLNTLYHPSFQKKVFAVFSAATAVTLVWWPLLNSIIAAGFFLFWLLFCKKQFSLSHKNGKLILLFISLYVLVLIGFYNSANAREAIFKIQQKSAFVIFPLIFGTTGFFTKDDLPRLFNWFSAALFCLCIFLLANGLVYYLQTGSAQQLYGYNINTLKNSSSIVIAVFCLFTFCFHLLRTGELTNSINKRILLLHSFASLFYLGFLFLLGNRMALLLSSIFLLAFIFKNIQSVKIRFVLLGLFVIIAVTAAVTNPSLKKQVAELTDFSKASVIQLDKDSSLERSWGGISLRIAIWTCSWDVIEKNWIHGTGTGDVQDELQAAYEHRKFYFASRYNQYNAHNQYLQQLLSNGILGLVCFALCIIIPLLTVFSRKRKEYLYLAFLIIFLCTCCTESFLEVNKGIVWYSFFNSVLVFMKKEDDH